MSHNFKKPKQHRLMGSERAKIARWAATIKDQDELDMILARMPAKVRNAALEQFKPNLKFDPVSRIAESNLDTQESVGNTPGD